MVVDRGEPAMVADRGEPAMVADKSLILAECHPTSTNTRGSTSSQSGSAPGPAINKY